MSVAVIGGGVAGAAAAWELARQGLRATVFHDSAGASALYSGALDLEPWDAPEPHAGLDADLARFADDLGGWVLGEASVRVATPEGNVRPARGRDGALLDLERCAGKRVAVVDLERDDWDAPLLAKSYSESRWARRSETHFYAARVQALQRGFERRISAYDFATLLDSQPRAESLLAALRESGVTPDAWLLGPWLGLTRPLAQELSASLGVPVGETTSTAGGTAGARFELARDALLARIAEVERVRVTRVERVDSALRVDCADGRTRDFDALVFATGGVAAGGISLERAFERRGGTGFKLSFASPLSLALDHEVIEGVSSLSSLDFVERGLSALLDVGISARTDGSLREQPGAFAAGDALAGKPRTALLAARSGIAAARGAHDYVRRSG